MNLNIHFPVVVAVLVIGFLVNLFNVVRASLSVLTVFDSRRNGSTMLLAIGHLRRTAARSGLQILVLLAVPLLGPVLSWWLTVVLTLDAIGDWHDRRVMQSLL